MWGGVMARSHQLRKPAFHSCVLHRDCGVFTRPYLVNTTCAATAAQEPICFRLKPRARVLSGEASPSPESSPLCRDKNAPL